MEKNHAKQQTYKYAFERIDTAIAVGFYLEAIPIEESILTDRLLRFCRDLGYSVSYDRATLGSEIKFLKEKSPEVLQTNDFTFLIELSDFWQQRNTCLHQIAKSEPGTPTLKFEELLTLAEQTAISGKTIVSKVGGWATKYKNRKIKLVNATSPQP